MTEWSGGGRGPPRLAEILLSVAVRDPEAREGILGDLFEEYREDARQSPGSAASRYWRAALGLALRYTLSGGLRRRRAHTPRVHPGIAARGWGPALLYDLRTAGRTLRRNRGLSAVVVSTLGLGIGVTTAIFAVFHAVVLRPLPFDEPHRLVRFAEVSPQGVDFLVSPLNFVDHRDQAASFIELASIRVEQVALRDANGAEAVAAGLIDASLFRVFRMEPRQGRVFTPDEARIGGSGAVAVLSDRLWKLRFGGVSEAVGQTLSTDRGNFEVIGIMPESLEFTGVDLWLPGSAPSTATRDDRRLHVYGRLRRDVPLQRAQAGAERIATRIAERFPESNDGWGVELMPFPDWIVGDDAKSTAVTLLAASGLLLVLIGANVSNLLLARTTTRQKEFGIRSALGAGRLGVARQIVSETLLLGVVGGLVGLATACLLIALVGLLPPVLPRLNEVDVGVAVILFAVIVSVVEGAAIGFGSAAKATYWKVREALSETGRVEPGSARRFGDLLVVGQLALAVTLLVAAGLLGRSFQQLRSVEQGFELDGLMTSEITLSNELPRAELPAVYRTVLADVRTIAGVNAASGTDMRYFNLTPRPFTELGRADAGIDDFVSADWRVITEDYFRTTGVPLLAGRTIDHAREGQDGSEVVVSRSLVEILWPNGDGVGELLRWEGPHGELSRIVGVVGNVSDVHPGLTTVPSVYVSYERVPRWAMTLLVRADPSTAGLAGALRESVHEVDRSAAVSALRPLRQSYTQVLSPDRFLPSFFAVVAVAAMILAGLGIYGLLSFTVSRRAHDIGIRMALGGRPGSMLRMLFLHGVKLVALGVIAGTVGALVLTRTLAPVLFEIDHTDPPTYVIVAVFVTLVSLAATYVPARRATRVDPLRVRPT